jgi:hypothetical protein
MIGLQHHNHFGPNQGEHLTLCNTFVAKTPARKSPIIQYLRRLHYSCSQTSNIQHPHELGIHVFAAVKRAIIISPNMSKQDKLRRTLLLQNADVKWNQSLTWARVPASTRYSPSDPLRECAFPFTFLFDRRRRPPLPSSVHLPSSVVTDVTCRIIGSNLTP